ncbi:DUF362 domain-containing protein [Chloroflexota bacterium]
MAKVSITKTDNDVYAALVESINNVGERLISRGDRALIKPNLVEPAAPDSGQITSPKVIEAVARYCLDYGAAQVIIGEGPSYYQPRSRLRECFTRTGVSEVANRLGIEWVLFDEHRYRTFKDISDCTPAEFRVTEFAFNCDKFIDLPVLKTHYLTKVTLAMKNLKGCLKREDKPLFHHHDLSRAVVELCKIVRPTINVIDCTARTVLRQLGDGCAPEETKSSGGLLIVSSDIVATDTVGCALMGVNPQEVRTVTLGEEAGLGESDLTRIDIIGEELKRLEFKVELPQEQLQQSFPLLEITGAENACSGCLIPLISCFSILREQQAKLESPLAICLGKDPKVPKDKAWLLVGDCAQVEGVDKLNWVGGCPPSKEELLSNLKRFMVK